MNFNLSIDGFNDWLAHRLEYFISSWNKLLRTEIENIIFIEEN